MMTASLIVLDIVRLMSQKQDVSLPRLLDISVCMDTYKYRISMVTLVEHGLNKDPGLLATLTAVLCRPWEAHSHVQGHM